MRLIPASAGLDEICHPHFLIFFSFQIVIREGEPPKADTKAPPSLAALSS